MSQPFLEFFERIRDTDDGLKPSEDGQEEVVEVENTDVITLVEDSDDEVGDDVDWDDVKQSTKLGPLLSSLRGEQEKQPMSQRESYSVEHLKRLYQFVPDRPYSKPRANKLCAKVHPKPCPYGCKSCHFCRQRTTEPKTVCSVCDGVNNYYGGPARGYWCGSCLWLRIGENIDEVRGRKDWVCPACRDICNCSGANCMRIKRGWFPTNQLSHEAKEQGYKSVAHYLVLTHLSEKASAAPMDLLLDKQRRRRKKPSQNKAVEEIVPPRRRALRQDELPLQFKGERTRRKALEVASKPRLEKEITEIVRDLGSPAQTLMFGAWSAALAENATEPRKTSHFLCILDDDMKDFDEEEEEDQQLQPRAPEAEGMRLPRAGGRESAPASALYTNDSPNKHVNKVRVVRPGPRKRQPVARVGEHLLPPKRPRSASTGRNFPQYRSPSIRSPAGNSAINHELNAENADDCGAADLEEGHASPAATMSEYVAPQVCRPASPMRPIQLSVTRQTNTHIAEHITLERDGNIKYTYVDEFIWNSLCLRAVSVIDAVKTFYKFHPDVSQFPNRLIDEGTDRETYEKMYESTQSMLQKVLRSAESLVTEDVRVKYCPDVSIEGGKYPGTLTSVGGVRRAVELLTYLSRILPEDDVTWRIEKRLLGFEPFVDFESSSPHTKALLLRGRLELVAILEKRRLCGPVALQNIGDTLATIAGDMKTALPLLDAIIENKVMPVDDCSISGWSYDDGMRGRKLVDVFTDLSVMYASLHEVLLLGIDRATELCTYVGTKSYHILTERLTEMIFNQSFPKAVIRSGFTLLCTMIDIGRESFTNENVGMTAEERNTVIRDREHFVHQLGSQVVPRLECLVQKDYHLWGRSRHNILDEKCRTEGLGSEKVEVLARCYALQIQANTVPWTAIESKATEPYSFSQYWKYANLRYRNFSLYLLAHTLENAPNVLKNENNVPSILRMWLLSVLDFGRHECSWYLTIILARHRSDILPPLTESDLDFRSDPKGIRRGALLRRFGNAVMAGQLRHRLASILLLLDECLEERRREIIQSSFNPDKALSKWQRSVMQAILCFLDPLAPLMCSSLPVGKELRRLFRRCAIWTVEGCSVTQKRCCARSNRGELSSPEAFSDLDTLSTEGDIRQDLESGACGTLREFMQLANLMRVNMQNAEGLEVDFLEPLWILVSGIIEMGNGDIATTPFDIALYDKVSASMFEIEAKDNPHHGANILDLHQYILVTHIRRYVLKANHRNQNSERFAVNALRLAYALFSRPEMRSIQIMKVSFNLMMTTWIGVFSQSGDGDSLAVRHELLHLLQLALKSHPSMVPIHGDSQDLMSNLYEMFWKTASREALGMVSGRFPQTILSSALMEAEYMYSQMLPSVPGLELFKPNTPQSLSELYNSALGALGRPPSLDIVENLHAKISLSDIIPRAFSQKLQEFSLSTYRPGDFGWTLARKSIIFLIAVSEVSVGEGEKGYSSPDAPGAWYSICCLPFLESLCRKGERATLLIENERKLYLDSIERHSPDIRDILPPLEPAQREPQSAAPPGCTGKNDPHQRAAHEELIRELSGVDTLCIGDIFSIECRLLKVRKIEKDGMKVAVCLLSSNKSQNSGLNVLISRPKDLVDFLLDENNTRNLPTVVQLRNVQLARQKVDSQVAVARSTDSTTYVNVSADQSTCVSSFREQSPFLEASRKLTQMGYDPAAVMMCIRRIQKETQGSAQTSAGIISKAIERLNS